ncbi:MAG: VWA domain-containing protein, partial [Actinobacteria bacterium]|nr:VWA domain-containing protein [Actinomycetota bacterium]
MLTNVASTNQAAGGRQPDQSDSEQPPTLRPVQIVVLVDESGSLNENDIAREREAARLIAQGELSPDSTIAIVGFASSDGPGQSPTHPVCPPTKLNSAENRQLLADCIGELKERGENEGNGTDHVAALRQALNYLDDSAVDQPKIVFLLTDGKLDVSKSETYGKSLSAEDRTEAARQQIPGVLDELNRAGVQVWPLGFGNVDSAQLESFAAGAAQRSCGLQTPTPRARVIGGSADLLSAVRDAYATANCIGPAEIDTDTVPSGGRAELTVDIPAIATDGAILVFKRDPRVTVSYVDPQGTTVPKVGPIGISKFEVSGENTEAESLRIVDPIPGRWTVRLNSAPSVPDQDVAATVIFQGAIRAVLTVSPPTPAAGQVVDVAVQVRARQAPITDPALLRDLSFVATLSGRGGLSPVMVELTDSDADGVYTGQLTVPADASGELVFTGSVTGLGVNGDERVFYTRVAPAPLQVHGQLRLLFDDSEVRPGESVPGTVVVTNDSGEPQRLRLQVADTAPGTQVTPQPAVLDLAPAGSSELDFALEFAADTALGPNQATLQLIDEADTIIAQQQFASNVVPVPPIWERLLWLWLLLGIAILATLAFLIRRAREQRRAQTVRQVRVELYQGSALLAHLDAPDTAGKVFRFSVADHPFLGPRLERPQRAEDVAFQIERSNRSGFRLTTLYGENLVIQPGDRQDIGNG